MFIGHASKKWSHFSSEFEPEDRSCSGRNLPRTEATSHPFFEEEEWPPKKLEPTRTLGLLLMF